MRGKLYVAEEKFDLAQTALLKAIDLDPNLTSAYDLLIPTYLRANKLPEHERALRRLAELYRSRGDESRARDILQHFATVGDLVDHAAGDEEFAPGGGDELHGGALLDDDSGALFGDEFPDSEGAPELSIDFGSELEIGPGASLSGAPRQPVARERACDADTRELTRVANCNGDSGSTVVHRVGGSPSRK